VSLTSLGTGLMREFEESTRRKLRDLSLGKLGPEDEPENWGLWSMTWRDGSTYACVGYRESSIVGWAGASLESDCLPVVGVFVGYPHRGRGYGKLLVQGVLRHLMDRGKLHKGDPVFASTGRWKKYPAALDELGLRCLEWV
jgi:GNAT superfamily N-acetyltransferase